VTPAEARLRLFGDAGADPEYVERLLRGPGAGAVSLEGRFGEGETARVFAGMDVLVVPSVGLESYGLVVDEAMAHGVPVVASRLGALTERFTEECGAFFPAGDARALKGVVERLVARPETVAGWRRALPRVRTLEDAAARIEEIYDEVLGSAAAGRGGGR
jgi:glycosyltransferase involved in cell wall biosynthesis